MENLQFQATKLSNSVNRMINVNKTTSSNDDGNKVKNDGNVHLLDTSHKSQYSRNLDVLRPFLKQYSLALSTTILATVAFAFSLASSLSCSFLQVPADAYDDITQTDHYLDYNRSREKDEVLALGLFCEEDLKFTVDPTSKEHSLRKLSKAFFIMALIVGAANMCVTWSIATCLGVSNRIWNGITILSIANFVLQLSVFVVFKSPPCDSYKCVLATGGFALICSAFINCLLVLVTYFFDVPEWKEEWELWRLVKSNRDRGLERGDTDLEVGVGGLDSSVGNGSMKRGDGESNNDRIKHHDIEKFMEKEISKKVEKIEAWNDLHSELMRDFSEDSSANKEISHLCKIRPSRRMKHNNLESMIPIVAIPNISTARKDKYINMDDNGGSPITPSRYRSFKETPLSPITTDGLDDNSVVHRPRVSPISACTGLKIVPLADVDGGVWDGTVEDGAEVDALLPVCGAGDVTENETSIAAIVSPEPSGLEPTLMKSLAKKLSHKEIFKRRSSKSFNDEKSIHVIDDGSAGNINGTGADFSEKYQIDHAENAAWGKSICNNVEKLSGDAMFSPPPIIVRELNSAVISPIDDESDGNQLMPPITNLKGSNRRYAVVSPDKDSTQNDPDVEYYPSESSMSEISLPTGSEHNSGTDTDDDRAHAPQALSVASDDSNDSSGSSDINAIIAGVQFRNRRTSGKITPMNKRRHRRRKSKRRGSSDMSSGNSYSSCGSLLDEVIPEEADADISNETSPQKVYTGPTSLPIDVPKHVPPTVTTDFTKGDRKTRKATMIHYHISDDDQSGYESGYLSRVSNDSHLSYDMSSRSSRSSFISRKSSRYCQLLDHGEVASFAGHVSFSSPGSSSKFSSSRSFVSIADESMSSRAARARRSRILSNKKVLSVPIEVPSRGISLLHDGFEFQPQPKFSIENFYRSEAEGILLMNSNFVSSDDEGVGNLSVRSNVSWQARKRRMNRLRMQRGQSTNTVERKHNNTMRGGDDNIACNSDEGSI
ncbi:hypothetical protein ACHAXS_009471 [Conticribra weissflogii]